MPAPSHRGSVTLREPDSRAITELYPEPFFSQLFVPKYLYRLPQSLGPQCEHARHAEDGVVGGDEGATGAGLKELVQRCFVYRAGADADARDASHVDQLAVSRIELRIRAQRAVVLMYLAVGDCTPDATRDEPALGIDFIRGWQLSPNQAGRINRR